MNKESENLRDLLHYLKTDYYKDKPEEYEEKDTECKERLYDMISEDVSGNHNYVSTITLNR